MSSVEKSFDFKKIFTLLTFFFMKNFTIWSWNDDCEFQYLDQEELSNQVQLCQGMYYRPVSRSKRTNQ